MSNACVNSLPPLFLLLIFGGSYYIYLYHYCLSTVKNIQNKIIYIVFLNVFTIMFLWSFFYTMWSSVGRVPIEYKFSRNQHQALLKSSTDDEKDELLESFCEEHSLLLYTCTATGSIRYCTTCMHIKPDRTHHCASCKTCVLKMDHHCPWVNNCIGFLNYKSFLLLLFYTCLYCFYYVSSTMQYILMFIEKSSSTEGAIISAGFGTAIMFGLVTFGFLCYHLFLVGKNETTIENAHNPNFLEDDLTFDLGPFQNIMEVFGNRWYLWLIPVFSSMGCGHMFLLERK